MSTPIRPSDVLPDGVDVVSIGDTTVRKGSVAAFVANAVALDSVEPGGAEEQALVDQLRELVPALSAVGVFDVFAVRSPRLAELLDLHP